MNVQKKGEVLILTMQVIKDAQVPSLVFMWTICINTVQFGTVTILKDKHICVHPDMETMQCLQRGPCSC